jgi:hypothetical protein
MVGVVDEIGQVSLKKITIGRDLGVSLLVTSGLQTTDRVIVNPPDSLATGDLVVAKVLPAAIKPNPEAGKSEPKPEGKADSKVDVKTESKPESKPASKTDAKSDSALEKLAPKDTVIAPKPSSMSQFKSVPTTPSTTTTPTAPAVAPATLSATPAKTPSPNLLAPAQQEPMNAKPAANNTPRSPS